jgi:hypothetical protein
MSIHTIALVASEAAEEAGEAGEINPYLYGATALVVLLLALFVITRFNVDR